MSKPESKPVVPALPTIGVYSPQDIQLFKRFNRESYQSTYAEQAPPWDKSRNIKRWFDTEALDRCLAEGSNPSLDIVQYWVFDQYANPNAQYPSPTCGLRKLRLTVADAASINLPGLVAYRKWVPDPTPAQVVCSFGVAAYDVNQICSYDDALLVAKSLGVGRELVRESTWVMALCNIQWNGETRRAWTIDWNRDPRQASFLLASMYSSGIAAPGKWDLSGAEPRWISDVQEAGEQDPRPEVPIPCRQLVDVERWSQVTPFTTVIYRTDIPNPIQDSKTSSGGAGLSSEQNAALMRVNEVAADVKKLLRLATS
jgi:hypothetical protein